MHTVGCNNFEQWRSEARELLLKRIPPEAVMWQSEVQQGLFDSLSAPADSDNRTVKVRVPADFLKHAQRAACFRGEEKWPLLYRLAWRLAFEQRDLLAVHSDFDVKKLRHMLRVIARDCHKMKAFVRFKKVATDSEGKEYFSAWFEPQHLITEAIAPFFVKRFTSMNWSILTPDNCMHWYHGALSFSPGIHTPPPTEDSLEQLWLAYYRSTFNPARVKLKAMQAEMPKYYWRNLPEAKLIAPLTGNASTRVEKMMNNSLSDPNTLREKSTALRAQQDALRERNQNQ